MCVRAGAAKRAVWSACCRKRTVGGRVQSEDVAGAEKGAVQSGERTGLHAAARRGGTERTGTRVGTETETRLKINSKDPHHWLRFAPPFTNAGTPDIRL